MDASAVLPPLKILAVDDSPTNLQILRVFLEKLGHQALLANSGEKAIALFCEETPDLVLMDIMMPGMSGFEATQKIREIPNERWVPIIFLSALDRDENLVAGLEVGGDDYLSKPINFVVLEARIRSIQRTLQLQTSVAESLHQLRAISNSVVEAIITIDTDGSVTSCNLATETLLGWAADELIGQNIKVIVPEPQRSSHDEYLRAYVSGGPPKIIGTTRELQVERRNGSQFEAELSVTEVRVDGQRMFVGVIRDISERKHAERLLRYNSERLQRYYDTSEAENNLAVELIERQLRRKDLGNPLLAYWLSPALNFSGDVIAAAQSADGKLFTLLADATGHGLTAAISTLPLLTLFYRLVDGSPTLESLLQEINQHLCDTMPVGRFVAATVTCIDPAQCSGELWIGGMPSAYLIDDDGKVIQEYPPTGLPLGIVGSHELEIRPVRFVWNDVCQLACCSDGLLEAVNYGGEQFGTGRLLKALAAVPPTGRKESVEEALISHLDTIPPQDDISLLLIRCPIA